MKDKMKVVFIIYTRKVGGLKVGFLLYLSYRHKCRFTSYLFLNLPRPIHGVGPALPTPLAVPRVLSYILMVGNYLHNYLRQDIGIMGFANGVFPTCIRARGLLVRPGRRQLRRCQCLLLRRC